MPRPRPSRYSIIERSPPLHPLAATSLAMALVASSRAPILLLDEDLTVISASVSFGEAFDIDPATVSDTSLADLGGGNGTSPSYARCCGQRLPARPR